MMKLHQALCLVSLYLTGQNVGRTSSTSTPSYASSTISDFTTSFTTVTNIESTMTISAIGTTTPILTTSSNNIATSGSNNIATSAITATPMTTSTGHSSISTAQPTTRTTSTPVTFICFTHTCIYKGCLTNATATNAIRGNCTGPYCTVVQRFDETSYNITAGCNSTCEESDQTVGNFTVRTRCCQGSECNKDDPGDVVPTRGNGGLAIRSAPFCVLYIFLVLVAFIRS